MKILNSFAWLIAISLFSSCSKEENEPRLLFPPESESFVTNGMTFPTEGGRQSFTFTPINQTFWHSTLSNEDDRKWCEVNYVYDFGKGQDVVANINVLENPELYERSTTLTIKVGDMQKQILIKQEKKIESLQVSTKEVKVDYKENIIPIAISSNCEYAMDIEPKECSWILNPSFPNRGGAFNLVIALKVAANTDSSSRECRITLKSQTKSESIKVFQAGLPAEVSEDEKKVEVSNCEAGKLPDILSVIDANKIEWLIIKGDINGTDLSTIRHLPTLQTLNLSEANITSGGEPSTTKNTISEGIFASLSISSIILPSNITYIGERAFQNSNITNITIPNTVTEIGKNAFAFCKQLKSIHLSNSITTIPKGFLMGAEKLTSIDIPKSVHRIEESAFHECSNLATVNMPNSINYIGAYAFAFCNKLTNILLPNSLKEIQESTFQNCKSLSIVTIPQMVMLVKYGAFVNCPHLEEVHVRNTSAPTILHWAFDKGIYFKLFVPKGYKDNYTASEWPKYNIEIIEE
ncbi:leucine-rich repeat protein [uncultured Bacteroides sp.]|uniref:leucine-rich repeat protein n=2 Tax=Bacteroides TaxID=816 RepID=UPI00258A0AEC|nr:leucine-rich repeat protein [uncultured Bacteroides sp.]